MLQTLAASVDVFPQLAHLVGWVLRCLPLGAELDGWSDAVRSALGSELLDLF